MLGRTRNQCVPAGTFQYDSITKALECNRFAQDKLLCIFAFFNFNSAPVVRSLKSSDNGAKRTAIPAAASHTKDLRTLRACHPAP